MRRDRNESLRISSRECQMVALEDKMPLMMDRCKHVNCITAVLRSVAVAAFAFMLSGQLRAQAVAADLSILKTVSDAVTTVGENTFYTLDVINNGPETSYNTVVTDPLPTNCVFVDAAQTSGTHLVLGNAAIFSIGTLDA